ncbi:MAG: TrkA-N domain protein [Solirubrobacteraceae bacterium]|nr:TrkA-N domain protein [Solirubrobacteraceae bacterium]
MSSTGRRIRERTKRALKASGAAAPVHKQQKAVGDGASLREKVRYRFDQVMARGPIALVGGLGVITLLLIVAFTIILAVTGTNSGHTTIAGKVFFSLLHALDPGQLGNDGFSLSPGLLLALLVLTLAGLFVVSALIGVIATGIDEKLVDLRKGRSRVLEKEHTLVLGWSETVFTIISELAIANESRTRPAVVILAEQDKVEMEDAIRDKVGDTANTRVICRTGSPIDLDDLEIVNHQTARSIIVLAPEGEDPDSEVIKTVLALTRGPRRREAPYHIVAEIQNPANLEAAHLVAGDEAVIIDKRETIARLIVQTARQSGASVVYTELFDFDGDEVYFYRDESLAAKTYGDALMAYEDCCVIGLAHPDGAVVLNPPAETRIDGHSVVAIAEDDSRLENAAPIVGQIDESVIVAAPRREEPPSRALILGWNDRGAMVVNELDQYVTAGSELLVLTEFGDTDFPAPANMTSTVRRASTTDRATLESLGVAGFDQIVVLCYANDLEIQRADARTLVTLLHLRDMLSDVAPNDRPAIVSEMLDDRNRELAQVTEVDDVIVSDKILSLVLTQISENARLEAVFGDLLDADGSEIYLRPVQEYVRLGAETSFATLIEAARRRDETAIGYRSLADSHDPTAQYGVTVNPTKAAVFTPAPGDRVVVLAED